MSLLPSFFKSVPVKTVAAGAGALLLAAGTASASAIIDNGTIQLGVDDFGQLNVSGGTPSPVSGTTPVGLRFIPTGNESTSHGCLCEGWGVGIADSGASGSANNDFGGASGLSLVSFASTASTATSVVDMGSDLRVTHDFKPATETSNLYRVDVTIENTSGAAIADLRYTRTFDWDIEPDTFSEFVTHGGVAAASSVLLAVDNGFVSSDPFAARSEIVAGGTGDFTDLGPADHGSNFDFGFGGLAAGESFSFEIFYGATTTEAGALAALGLVGAEVFSLGQPARDAAGTGAGGSNTFIFGFAGVGGTPLPSPNPIPVPAALWLFMTGIAGLYGMQRFKKS